MIEDRTDQASVADAAAWTSSRARRLRIAAENRRLFVKVLRLIPAGRPPARSIKVEGSQAAEKSGRPGVFWPGRFD
jgi:hypothetical protein